MRNPMVFFCTVALCSSISLLSGNHATASEFVPLGDLDGRDFDSRALAISSDGDTIVGRGTSRFVNQSGEEAFRWSSSNGLEGLGFLPNDTSSTAYSVSAEGTTIGGSSGRGALGREATVWIGNGNVVGLGDFPGGVFQSSIRGISADGSVLVGTGSSDAGPEAFIWTNENGMVGLGFLYEFPPDSPVSQQSLAAGVSADGTKVVGNSSSPVTGTEAYRWSEETGMINLGNLGGSFSVFSNARAISQDGNTVVGESNSANGGEAFVWTESDGMIGLGDLPGGGFNSSALAVSADGSVVVGYSEVVNLGFTGDAFVWTESTGMQSLAELLNFGGVDLEGWRLLSASGISADGLVIVGTALNPDGNLEAYMVNLTAVPLPPAVWLFGSALGLMIFTRRNAA